MLSSDFTIQQLQRRLLTAGHGVRHDIEHQFADIFNIVTSLKPNYQKS